MVEIKTYAPENHHLKCLIYGAPGTWKTTFAGSADDVLIGSAEAGLLGLKSWINYVEIKSFKDLQEVYKYLADGWHPYKTFALDSISEINDIIINELSAGKGQMYQADWWVLGKRMVDMLRKFRDLPMNVIFVSHETTVNDDERVVKYVPMLSWKTTLKIPGFFDVVWRIYINDKGEHKMRVEPRHDLVTKTRGRYITNDTPLSFPAWLEAFKKVKIQKQEVVKSIESVDDHIKIATEAGLNEDLYPRAEKTYKKLLEQSIEDIELQAGKYKAEIEKAPENLFTEEEKVSYYKFIDLACDYIKSLWLE